MLPEAFVNAFSGLDDDVYGCIARCWPPLRTFLTAYVLPRLDSDSIDLSDDYTQLRRPFIELESEVTAKASNDQTIRRRGMTAWRELYMLPLALELKLVEHAEEVLLRDCLRRGLICLSQLDSSPTGE